MSQLIGPREFNPALGGAMTGVAATGSLLFKFVDAIRDRRFMNNRMRPGCNKILQLATETHRRLVLFAQTFRRSELSSDRDTLTNAADEMLASFRLNFEPRAFTRAAWEAKRRGESPEHLMWRWCAEFVAAPLDVIDGMQWSRMKKREHRAEWRAAEAFKQEIVDLWGKEGFDVSRSGGSERNYVLRSGLKEIGRFIWVVGLAVILFTAGFVTFIKTVDIDHGVAKVIVDSLHAKEDVHVSGRS